MELFPNPADEQVQINVPDGGNGTMSLYNLEGKKMAGITLEPTCNTYSLDTKGFPTGNYYIVMQTNSSIQSKKITIIHH